MFIGRDRLFRYMHDNNIPHHPTKRQTERWISQQKWAQRFHKTRKRKSTRPILTSRQEALYQVDLSDLISYRERGYQYIDPQKIVSDNGGEFVGREFEEMLVDLGIEHIVTNPYSPTQNSVIERWNGTIKRSLYQQMHAKNTRRWVEQLPILVSNYNNLYHRSIRMTPNQAADLAKRVEVAATLRRNEQGKYIATPTCGPGVFQITEVKEPGPDAIGITVNVEEYVPPAPEIDSEDDDDEPVQRRRIDQRELDDLELDED